MAGSKISALPAVTTPAATDEFGVNQGGTSKKMTRAQIHTLEVGENLILPQENTPSDPTLKFSNNTGFYEKSAGVVGVAIAAVARYSFSATLLQTASSNGAALAVGNSSATNPTVLNNFADLNSGLGGTPDNPALIAGGFEAIRAEDPADLQATETSLWIFDDDANAMQQVVVGAAGSGSIASHRMLQIPDV